MASCHLGDKFLETLYTCKSGFAGPFEICNFAGRTCLITKGYVCNCHLKSFRTSLIIPYSFQHGSDANIKVVYIRNAKGIVRRPITKIV